MNKSEKQAKQWLIENKGLKDEEIKKNKGTPDFLTPIGGFEVKKLYGDKLIFYSDQMEQLGRFPDVKILVCNGSGEMVKEASYSEIDFASNTLGEYKIVATEMISIQVEKELAEELKLLGHMGETYSTVIRRLMNGNKPA